MKFPLRESEHVYRSVYILPNGLPKIGNNLQCGPQAVSEAVRLQACPQGFSVFKVFLPKSM